MELPKPSIESRTAARMPVRISTGLLSPLCPSQRMAILRERRDGINLRSHERAASLVRSSATGDSQRRTEDLPPLKAAAKFAASTAAQKRQQGTDFTWDLDWFHYTPWFYKPHYLIIGGISFIIGSNLATSPSFKTTLIAAAPVAVGWFIFLYMVPRQFSDFAKQYIQTHPECEEHARQQHAEEERTSP